MVGVSGQTKPIEAVRAPAFGWQLPDWMAPPPVPADNPMSAAKVELGRYLFFDARLAGLNYISCSTCHRPELGFTDGRPVAIGVTGERHPRNSQPLANIGYLPALTWADPAVTSLEERGHVGTVTELLEDRQRLAVPVERLVVLAALVGEIAQCADAGRCWMRCS